MADFAASAAGLPLRAFLFGVAVAAFARPVAARSRTPVGGRLALRVPWPIASIDPHRLDDAGAAIFGEAIFDTLYAPAADAERVADLIGRLDRGAVDVVVFTSSPQVDRLFEVARERGLEPALRQGLQRTRVAAVGPVVAEDLRRRGAPVHICPEQGFVMKNLVQHIRRALGEEMT